MKKSIAAPRNKAQIGRAARIANAAADVRVDGDRPPTENAEAVRVVPLTFSDEPATIFRP